MVILVCLIGLPGTLQAQTQAATDPGGLNLSLRLGDEAGDLDIGVAIQIVIVMTLLAVAPALVMLTTSFLRIIIVLGFLRNALGLQSTPPNQVLVGIAVFLSFFLMMPIAEKINQTALIPLENKAISSTEALELAKEPLREFMLKQASADDLEYFMQLASMPPTMAEDLPMRVVIPAFVVGELRRAFQMGFLIFLPFLVVDFVVATVLMAMGMMMMPPVIVSLPFKILLFVLADGWFLVLSSLASSF
ncbi:flagellar type III secretion system pore protein FliP [Ruficoccus amylovorans]|uniref:Flagellar biosynthetic protein FliP n=2 Tax=Ruficoccus amylovorans TaxID=1804625 RepID=A0A842HFH5_9BACT|nr:flagellar type III secretion system pore protein FliP [Ruficoccus amylovorans]MBC2595019.1 flagellar type III secretion system pore protein FliP [Ruficoccus amylovorans]